MDPAGRGAVWATVVEACTCCTEAPPRQPRHRVDLLEFASGKTRLLARGRGLVAAGFDRDGSLLLQRAGALRLERWPSLVAAGEGRPGEALMDGVVLSPPSDACPCDCCGKDGWAEPGMCPGPR
jgi:hypothetical protein